MPMSADGQDTGEQGSEGDEFKPLVVEEFYSEPSPEITADGELYQALPGSRDSTEAGSSTVVDEFAIVSEDSQSLTAEAEQSVEDLYISCTPQISDDAVSTRERIAPSEPGKRTIRRWQQPFGFETSNKPPLLKQ